MRSFRGAKRINIIRVMKTILKTCFIKNEVKDIEYQWLINLQTEKLTT